MQRIFKFALIVIFVYLSFFFSNNVFAQSVKFDWVKTEIIVPYNANIYDYQDEVIVYMYVDGILSDDFIVRKEVNYTSFRTVTTNYLGTYRVSYQAYSKTYNIKETKDIYFHVVDTIPPLIVGPDEIELEYGTSFNVDDFYKISDNETKKESIVIKIKDENVTYTILGLYSVSIVATDSSGNKQEKTLKIRIIDKTPPTIKVVKDLVFSYGKTPELSSYFSISDNYDGYNVNSSISVVDKVGKSIVTVTAKDSSGNSISLDFECLVVDDESPDIELSKYETTIDPRAVKNLSDDYWLSFISECYDNYSEEISYYVESNVSDEIGDYIVTIYAYDEFENESYRSINVYVRESKGPLIEYKGPSEIYKGETINLSEYIYAYDEYDGSRITKVEILDEIDTTTTGDKLIRIRAYNTSGKYTIKEISIKVTDEFELFFTRDNIVILSSIISSILIIVVAIIIKKNKTRMKETDVV